MAIKPANPFSRHIIVERPDIRIDHFRSIISSDTVAFTFSDRESRDITGPGFGTSFLLRNGIDVLAIKTSRPLWFENLLPGDISDVERWLSWRAHPYTRRLGYGSSMGAYGALRLSRQFAFDRVLAVSPLFDIKNDWEKRWQSDRVAMSPDRRMFSLPAGRDETTDQISDHCDYFMIFDPLTPDVEHARRFQAIIPAHRLQLVPLPYSGHPSMRYLDELEMLGPVVTGILMDGQVPALAKLRRNRRTQSPTYFYHLAEHCATRGHLAWALRLNKRLIAIRDEPGYHVQTGRILDRLARYTEAVAALDRALAWMDYAFGPQVEKYKIRLLNKIGQTVPIPGAFRNGG